MKRLISILVVLIVAVATLAVAVSAVVSERLTRTRIAERIGTWYDGAVTLHGEPAVTIFPAPGFKVSHVTLSDPDAAGHPPLATISSLKASLEILPLLMGRIEVDSLTLNDPRVHLVEEGGNRWGGGPGSTSVFDALLSALGDPHLRQVDVRDGVIVYESRRTGRVDTITAADLRLTQLGPEQAAALSGTFVWRDKLIEIHGELDEPRAALSGERSDLHLTLSAEPVPSSRSRHFDFLERGPDAGEAERLESAPRQIAERLGIVSVPGSRLGPLTVSGTVRADERKVTLSRATFETRGGTAEGRLALRFGGERPVLDGSLDFGEFDLAPYVDAYLPKSFAELLARPLSAGGLGLADFDIKARADGIDLGRIRLDETALELVVRDGRMLVVVDNAALADGDMQGSLAVEPGGEGVAVRLSGRLEDVSVADGGGGMDWIVRANPLIGAYRPPQGTGTVSFDLSARGATIGALVESVAGSAVADIRNGSVDGADIVSTLERLEDGDVLIAQGKPFIPVPGRSRFSRMAARLTLEAGVAHIEQVRIAGDRFEVSLAGEGDLRRGDMEAGGVASLYAPGWRSGDVRLPPIVELPFGVGGTIRDPMVAPGIPRVSPSSWRTRSHRSPRRGGAQPARGDRDRRGVAADPRPSTRRSDALPVPMGSGMAGRPRSKGYG